MCIQKNTLLKLLIGLTFLFGCKDIFEEDLREKKIKLMAPPANYQTTRFTHTFWWEEVEGATTYNLQIVSPKFSYIEDLVLDTMIESNKYNFSLEPGEYQWRVRAENNSTTTDYNTRTLTIDSSADLNDQTLILLSPKDNLHTNNLNISFDWQPVFSAEEYRLQVADPDFTSSGNILFDQTTAADSITLSFTSEGDYKWRVRAQNQTSQTDYVTRNFSIDTTPPAAPVLLTPIQGDSVGSPALLIWSNYNDTDKDSLVIYPDSMVSPPTYQANLTDTTYSFSGTSGNEYFWRVRSKDKAGNTGSFSILEKFYLQ